MEKKINISTEAAQAIIGFTDDAGTFEFFDNTLMRVFHSIIYNSDDLGMSDAEALDTIRSIQLLRNDLKAIAGDKLLGESLRLALEYNDEADENEEAE